MRWRAIGVHEGDGERLAAFVLDQLACRSGDCVLVERQQDFAVGTDAFGDFQAAVARHQRGRRVEEQVVEIVASLAADLDAVAESIGGEQARQWRRCVR